MRFTTLNESPYIMSNTFKVIDRALVRKFTYFLTKTMDTNVEYNNVSSFFINSNLATELGILSENLECYSLHGIKLTDFEQPEGFENLNILEQANLILQLFVRTKRKGIINRIKSHILELIKCK